MTTANNNDGPSRRMPLETGYALSIEATANASPDRVDRIRRLERVIGFYLGSTTGPLFDGPATLVRLHDRVPGLTAVWSDRPTAAQRAAVNHAWKLLGGSGNVRTLHKIEYGDYA
jgi:hypothetical protein